MRISKNNPVNVALFNSDGVNTFAIGAFAPGVTVTDAMYATDAGVKWRGLAVNTEYFFRWLNNFPAHAPFLSTRRLTTDSSWRSAGLSFRRNGNCTAALRLSSASSGTPVNTLLVSSGIWSRTIVSGSSQRSRNRQVSALFRNYSPYRLGFHRLGAPYFNGCSTSNISFAHGGRAI